MGGASVKQNKPVSDNDIKNEQTKQSIVHSINEINASIKDEKIVMTMNTIISKVFNKENNIITLENLIPNKELVNDFYAYFTSSSCMKENMKFFQEMETIVKYDESKLLPKVKALFTLYETPKQFDVEIDNKIEKYILTKYTNKSQYEECYNILLNITNELFLLLVMNQLPNYLKQLVDFKKTKTLTYLLDKISWIELLYQISENLPIVLSIASAKKNQPNFKLLYVNKNYEAMTEYTRHEIIGLNAKYLQAGKAEKETIAKMSLNLKESKPINVSITNSSKNSRLFRNLLTFKPIFDQNEQYHYVFAMQFDSTIYNTNLVKFYLCCNIFNLLPNTIICRDNE